MSKERPAVDDPGRWRVTIRDENGEIQYAAGVLAPNDSLVIGRSSDCDISIPYSFASRKHVRLSLLDDQCRVEDLGSKNGVIHNRKRVEEVLLAPGSSFRIGKWRIHLERNGVEQGRRQKSGPQDAFSSPVMIGGIAAGVFAVGLLLYLVLPGGDSPGEKTEHQEQDTTETAVSPEHLKELHRAHRHREAIRRLRRVRSQEKRADEEVPTSLRRKLLLYRDARELAHRRFRQIHDRYVRALNRYGPAKRTELGEVYRSLTKYREEFGPFLNEHPEIRDPVFLLEPLLPRLNRLAATVYQKLLRSWEQQLARWKRRIHATMGRGEYGKALDQARNLKSKTEKTVVADRGTDLLKQTREKVSNRGERLLKKVGKLASSAGPEKAQTLLRNRRSRFEGTPFIARLDQKINQLRKRAKKAREKKQEGNGDVTSEKDQNDLRRDRRRYRKLRRKAEEHRTAFRFDREAKMCREAVSDFRTGEYKFIARTRARIYKRMDRLVREVINWINNGSSKVRTITTRGQKLKPVRADRRKIVLKGSGSTVEQKWATMEELHFLESLLREEKFNDKQKLSFAFLLAERGKFRRGNDELKHLFRTRQEFRKEISRYLAMKRERTVPEEGFELYMGNWMTPAQRQRAKEAQTKIGPSSPRLQWNVPKNGSVIYSRSGVDRGIWLHGPETNRTYPSPSMVDRFEDVPLFLAFVLPGKKVGLYEQYRHHQEISGRDGRRKGLVPTSVSARGQWRGIQDINGETMLVLKQTVSVETPGESYTPARRNVEKPTVLQGGHIRATLYVHPEKMVVRRVEFTSELRFNHLPDREDGADGSSGTYRSSRTYELVDYRTGESDGSNGGALAAQVKEAVNDGVAYLKKKQKQDGSWTDHYGDRYPAGETALVLLALLESGVEAKSSVIQKGAKYLQSQPFKNTYSVALSIMAVERLHTPPSERQEVGSYVKGENEDFETTRRDLPSNAYKWMKRAAAWLLLNMKKNGTWGYGKTDPDGNVDQKPASTGKGGVILYRTGGNNGTGNDRRRRWSYDHSNTQYAMLGLHAAARCGVFLHRNHWGRILEHWLSSQEEQGPGMALEKRGFGDRNRGENNTGTGSVNVNARAWGYRGRSSSRRISMTPVGVASVQIARHNLKNLGGIPEKFRKPARKSVLDGLGWVQKYYNKYSLTTVPEGGDGWDDYYDMYSIERAMMLTGTWKIGGNDWYRNGAKQLIEEQKDNGSWGGSRRHTRRHGAKDHDIVETCFAILFLKRATIPTGGVKTEDSTK